MPRIARPAILLAAATLVVVAASAGATTGRNALTFKDPVGDSTAGRADIVSVQYSTTGTGSGKKYVPKVIVAKMTLAAPATTDGTTEYKVRFTASDCGEYYMSYVPGTRLGGVFAFADCGSPPDETGSTSTSFDFSPTVDGKSVTFRVNLKGLPGLIKPGAELMLLNASTKLIEPATGIFSVSTYDEAKTTDEYVVG
ncbi:MAG: hypothetical protein ABIO67_06885 [Mycobacteriales bacterium]